MNDLVKRLRDEPKGIPFPSIYHTMQQAADRIEQLTAERDALLIHLPELWGDCVIDGELLLRVNADAIDAAMKDRK